jgi:hypothetical protein
LITTDQADAKLPPRLTSVPGILRLREHSPKGRCRLRQSVFPHLAVCFVSKMILYSRPSDQNAGKCDPDGGQCDDGLLLHPNTTSLP